MKAMSQNEFVSVLEDAKQIGPAALSNDDLLRFCRNAYGHFAKHFWIDAQPFFVELWRRVEAHQIPGIRTKAEACRHAGCSERWGQMLVAGTAKDSNKHKANRKRTECEVSSRPHALSDNDYVDAIARYAEAKLEDLKSAATGGDFGRFAICFGNLSTKQRQAGITEHKLW
jgi:hypothetical protein